MHDPRSTPIRTSIEFRAITTDSSIPRAHARIATQINRQALSSSDRARACVVVRQKKRSSSHQSAKARRRHATTRPVNPKGSELNHGGWIPGGGPPEGREKSEPHRRRRRRRRRRPAPAPRAAAHHEPIRRPLPTPRLRPQQPAATHVPASRLSCGPPL
jgi:hypothetical protein